MKKVYPAICLLIIVCSLGCLSSNQSARYKNSSQDSTQYYTSSFPSKDVSSQLKHIQRSILRFTATGFYNTYYFSDQNITLEELRKGNHARLASRSTTIDESKAGTAISLLQNDNRSILITAQHILSFPDTVVVYKRGRNIPNQTFVESIGIKDSQRNYLFTGNQILPLNIVTEDATKDLALIEVETPTDEAEIPPLKLNFGKAKNLQVGSFVFVMGFPLGSPMVTRGIVSAPDFDNRGRFLTDALFNHGISGGIIIATRTHFNSFEWVGMAVTASALKQQFLIPDPSKKNDYKNFEAYTDTAVVSEKRLINYGLTQATPAEQILTFLLEHENVLNKFGFSVTDIMN